MPTSEHETSEQEVPYKYRRACITDWSWPVEPVFSAKLAYLAYAHEIAPTTGKDHWQAFAYAKTQMPLAGWKKLFPGAHIEAMRSDFAKNEIYCSKEGQLIEHGVRPRQGERSDLNELKVLLDSGKRPMEIADEVEGMFSVVARTERFSENYFEYKRRKVKAHDRELPKVYIRWGPPGTGKTRWMDDTFGKVGWTRHPDNTTKWNDGCDCDVILFDDVKANEIPPIARLLVLTDRYPVQVKRHNGFLTWKPKTIVFTSNFPPHQWWPNEHAVSLEAFFRRVTETVYVDPARCTNYVGFEEINIKEGTYDADGEVREHIELSAPHEEPQEETVFENWQACESWPEDICEARQGGSVEDM